MEQKHEERRKNMERVIKIECCPKDNFHMDERQLKYFKNKLIYLKANLLEKIYQNKEKIKTMKTECSDIIDQSNTTVAIYHEIRSQERHHQLLKQINAALCRIENGSFGYCKITGTPIESRRLEALPFTTLSIEAIQKK